MYATGTFLQVILCATAASQATAVALRGHGPELHEQTENQYTPSSAFERHLKKIEEPTTAGLFSSALTYDPKVEISDFSINKDELNRFNDAAKLAESGFEMLFAQDEECASDDSCTAPDSGEQFVDIAVNNILPLMSLEAESEGFELTKEDILYAVSFIPTEGTDYLPDNVVEFYYGEGTNSRRRLADSCPNVHANKCMAELDAVIDTSLSLCYDAMGFFRNYEMAVYVRQRFSQAQKCSMEGWINGWMGDNDKSVYLKASYWNTVGIVKLFGLGAEHGFARLGYKGFMALVRNEHTWWQFAVQGVLWAANVLGNIASFCTIVMAKLALRVWWSGSGNVFNYVQCISA